MTRPFEPPKPLNRMPPGYAARPAKPTAKPRKVWNGIKLASKSFVFQRDALTNDQLPPAAWLARRVLALAEANAHPQQFSEGVDYARTGQARSLDIEHGSITANVQGRMPRGYRVSVSVPVFSAEQWHAVLDALAAEARFGAALLSGSLDEDAQSVFEDQNLRLVPSEPSELALSCNCAVFKGEYPADRPPPTSQPINDNPQAAEGAGDADPAAANGAGPAATEDPPVKPAADRSAGPIWCKHICCVFALLADRLSREPLLIFRLRGMNEDDVLEELRQRRAAASVRAASPEGTPAPASAPIYRPFLPGLSDAPHADLPADPDAFWSAGADLSEIDLPMERPEVSHPLLRRLGPSPFEGARFPLVGLLATCYDLVTDALLTEPPTDEDGDAAENDRAE